MQASDCILRPQEGTDFSKRKIWAWNTRSGQVVSDTGNKRARKGGLGDIPQQANGAQGPCQVRLKAPSESPAEGAPREGPTEGGPRQGERVFWVASGRVQKNAKRVLRFLAKTLSL